jgi:hypothetical protein
MHYLGSLPKSKRKSDHDVDHMLGGTEPTRGPILLPSNRTYERTLR